MAVKHFPLGDKQTGSGYVGGLSHPGPLVNTKTDMSEITPRTAQTSKLNYKKKTGDGPQGRS